MRETDLAIEGSLTVLANELVQMQKIIEEKLRKVKDEIRNTLETTEVLPGVKMIGKYMGTVKFSTVAENNMVLSPEYYFPSASADHIMNQIRKTNSVDEMVDLIKKIIKAGKVVDKGVQYRLNQNIINTLQSIIFQCEVPVRRPEECEMHQE